MFNSTGNLAGTRQGSVEVVHVFPINYNTVADNTPVLVGVIKASTSNPVIVEVGVQVVTAFNATTTNVLTVGTTTSANEWLTAAAVNELVTGFYPFTGSSVISTGVGAATASTGTPDPCVATGLVVGDRIISVTGLISGIGATIVDNGGDFTSSFESVVTVVNEIQQIANITTGNTKSFLVSYQKGGAANSFRLTADTNIYVNYDQSGTAATAGSARIIVREFSENILPIA